MAISQSSDTATSCDKLRQVAVVTRATATHICSMCSTCDVSRVAVVESVAPSSPLTPAENRAAAVRQAKLIADARRLLRPSPVRIHHIPNWFRLALLKAYGCDRGDTSAHSVLRHAEHASGQWWHWLDHWGSTTYHGRPCFVSEPYHLSEADVAAIAELCRRCNLDFHLSSNSWWFPGSTVRAVISQKQSNATSEPVAPHDTQTEACINWTEAGVPPGRGSCRR